MSSRSMNVYLKEKNYLFLKNNIPQRKISEWINEAIDERIKNSQEDINDLVKGYRLMSKDKDLSKFSSDAFEESMKKTYE